SLLSVSICLPGEIDEVSAQRISLGVICGLKTLFLSGLRAKSALVNISLADLPGYNIFTEE
ncbi:hypothetical protein, partial [Desulfonatronospira sp.]|uniref:hypothetical protein n=1 Tax=Desulfonatronospira sp. TaxID=1962951 RepID=UPI0025C56054